MICFKFLRIFGEKLQKWKLEKIWAKLAPTPQRKEPTPQRRPNLQHGMPHRNEAEGPKWHPSSSGEGLCRTVNKF